MVESIIEYLRKDLYDGGQNHVLLYGKPEETLVVLKGVFDRAKENEEFLCSWHDASKIAQPMDFFEPILRLKYGGDFDTRIKDLVSPAQKQTAKNKIPKEVMYCAELCAREKNAKNRNARKLPIIFIDGIDELFFKMDYCHLDETGIKKLLNRNFFEQPLPRGFGNCLRARLHQTNNGIFYGAVWDYKSIQYRATLGNYHYTFFALNFMPRILGDWQK